MYTFNSRVRFSESDSDGFIKIESIVNYVQDCSVFQSEDIGVGISRLKSERKSWVLLSWHIEIIKYPRFGENIVIGTQAYDFNKRFGFRNFMITNKSGEFLVKADSRWTLIDLDTGKMLKLTDEDINRYDISDKLEMSYPYKRISEPDFGVFKEPIIVEESLLDTNGHVNNEKYIELALRYLPIRSKIKVLRVEYRREALFGDKILPKVSHIEDRSVVSLKSIDGKTYCITEFI